ncbi:MAG: hypothetical protein WCI75_20940, partial [candidate division NC10 bacterium]
GPVDGVGVRRNGGGRLILAGSDCAGLRRQAAALSQWALRLGEASAPPGECACGPSECLMDAEASAPEIVRYLHGVHAGRWGPNCWNSVLVAAKILPALRFSPPEEMSFWMASPLCRMLGPEETPVPGDIVAIRAGEGEEVHGFVYVTEELVFSKNQLTAASPYLLQDPELVFAEFPVPAGCRKVSGAPSADCPAYANYFRCGTSAGVEPVTPYASAERTVADAERSVSKLALTWKLDPSERSEKERTLQKALEDARSVQDEASAQAQDPSLPEHERLLWRALQLRIEGVAASLGWML